MKYERIIIAAMVCVTAIVCCKIMAGQNRWQFERTDVGIWLFDKASGSAYRPVEVKGDVVFVKEKREDGGLLEALPVIEGKQR